MSFELLGIATEIEQSLIIPPAESDDRCSDGQIATRVGKD